MLLPKLTTRMQFAFYRLLEHLCPLYSLKKLCREKRTKLSQLAYEQIKSYKGKRLEIPRLINISSKDFKKNYINKGIPVVLDGKAKSWPCINEWTPEILKNKFGDEEVDIFIPKDEEDSNNLSYNVARTTLKEIMTSLEEGDDTKYSRFNRLLYDHPELLKDIDYNWLKRMRCLFSSGKTFQLFLGAKKTQTQLHAASEHNIFTQIHGTKHWYILSSKYDILLDSPVTGAPYFHTQFDAKIPDLKKFPAWEHMDIYECTLKPGDILFNPPSFWHQVDNTSASIGLGFRWFGVIDCFRFNFSQAMLTLLSTNPPIWFATKNRTNFAKIFAYMNKKNQIKRIKR